MNCKDFGKYGEDVAVEYLLNQNYKIITRNFYCKQGEIDIIAQDKNEIVFCEVKTRNNFMYGKPVDSVNNKKQNHIWKTAEYYLYINNLINRFIRFDVIEIYIKNNKTIINQIQNMFS